MLGPAASPWGGHQQVLPLAETHSASLNEAFSQAIAGGRLRVCIVWPIQRKRPCMREFGRYGHSFLQS
jgi:hypothetical protein